MFTNYLWLCSRWNFCNRSTLHEHIPQSMICNFFWDTVYYESKSNKYTKSKFNEWVHSSSVLIEMITLISHGVLLLDAPPPQSLPTASSSRGAGNSWILRLAKAGSSLSMWRHHFSEWMATIYSCCREAPSFCGGLSLLFFCTEAPSYCCVFL